MTKTTGLWLFVLGLLCLIPIQVANAQLNATVDVDVTESNGIFTYEYTVSNSILSGPINGFLLTVAKGTDVVEADGLTFPDGWVGNYDPLLPGGSQAADLQVGFIAGDGLTCGDESSDILAGGDGTFTVKSRYGPEEEEYLLFKAVDDPVDGPCGNFAGDPQIEAIVAPSIPPVNPTPTCDFDGNGDCDLVDIDALGVTIAGGTNAAKFDLTGDSLVNLDDLNAFLQDERVNKLNGDLDFDGLVGFPDFLVLSSHFGNEGVWSEGNIVPDTPSIGFPDFLVFSTNFNQSAQAVAASVPEPTSLWLAGLAMICLGAGRRGQIRF